MTEQDNNQELQQLVEINAQPPAITDNFEAVKAALAEHLERYRTIVDPDELPQAKAAATEINKLKGTLDERIKAAIAEIRAPIDQLDAKRKELVKLCEDSRQDLLGQINAFEAEKRRAIDTQIEKRRDALWDEYGVEVAYRRAEYADLVKLTAVTGKGALTRATDLELVQRVTADLHLQQRVERRLLELENRSYRAGLGAPLTGDHVRHVLEADDATYENEVDRLIAVELEREEQAHQRRQAQEARRTTAPAAEPKPDPTPEPGIDSQAPEEPQEPLADPSTDPDEVFGGEPEASGKRRCTVVAYFTLEVGAEVSDADISAECRRVLEGAGITTLSHVEVQRQTQAA